MTKEYSGDHPDGPAPDSESQEMTSEKMEWLENLPPKDVRYDEPEKLPRWAKLAIAKYHLGMHDTWKEAAEAAGKSPGSLYNYRDTPGGEAYDARFQDILDDPMTVAENLLRGEAASFTLDFISMFEAAKDANDYTEVRKMWSELMDRLPGGMKKKSDVDVGQASITFNFGSPDDLKPLEVEAEYEELDGPDYETVEDDD